MSAHIIYRLILSTSTFYFYKIYEMNSKTNGRNKVRKDVIIANGIQILINFRRSFKQKIHKLTIIYCRLN